MIIISRTKFFAMILAVMLIMAAIGAGGTYLYFDVKNAETKIDATGAAPQVVKNFNEAKKILETYYYKPIDSDNMVEGAIEGMAYSLNDPYTSYFTKEQMQKFTERTEGVYYGIGVSMNTEPNGMLKIVEVFDGSPAKDVGMMPNDVISQVDGKSVSDIGDEQMIVQAIKGPENTKVTVTVYRASEEKFIDFVLTRRAIKISNIESRMLTDTVGYIRIFTFDAQINEYFGTHLDKLLGEGMKKLVIDVRDNPGGSYSEVVNLADRFLSQGLIVYTERRDGERQDENADAIVNDIPICLLINDNSASASEILAGALKDNKRGYLIGTKTFGKGLVQQLYEFPDGAGLKFTIARYFTPSGVCIDKIGIAPDLKVENDAKYANTSISQIPKDDDKQLNAAIEYFKTK